ncbi:hypothetical protein GUJ93_ZPchr0010g7931 [Zizania palustris]|uniref:Tobamovirus multiplication protein 2A n=1 Tax=Zizania palustris TaxID=103762 RepID=A0A8J5WEG8_ZIZPA|nr:hypothetical protein GUJ93_ZPchr0010g7931 [Zizania palustris]
MFETVYQLALRLVVLSLIPWWNVISEGVLKCVIVQFNYSSAPWDPQLNKKENKNSLGRSRSFLAFSLSSTAPAGGTTGGASSSSPLQAAGTRFYPGFDRFVMACRGFFECLLKLLNFVLTVTGLAIVGYGIYLLVEWMRITGGGKAPPSPAPPAELLMLGRPMLTALSLGDGGSFFDKLPKAWFIYLFIGVGAVIFLISLFGCIGASTRNTCCLCCYAFLVILLILVEAGAAAFIFFDDSWKDVIPVDKTDNFDVIYDFLKDNWEIARWVALGSVIFEVTWLQLKEKEKGNNLASYGVVLSFMACCDQLDDCVATFAVFFRLDSGLHYLLPLSTLHITASTPVVPYAFILIT